MTKKKINNIRKCILTNKKLPKSDLIRLIIVDNNAIIDSEQKIKTRGYYLINDQLIIKNNIQKLIKKLKINNGNELYEKLIN